MVAAERTRNLAVWGLDELALSLDREEARVRHRRGDAAAPADVVGELEAAWERAELAKADIENETPELNAMTLVSMVSALDAMVEALVPGLQEILVDQAAKNAHDRVIESEEGLAKLPPELRESLLGAIHTNIRVADPEGQDHNVELDRALGGTRSERELREVFAEVLAAVSSRTRGGDVCMWINAAGFALSTRPHFETIVRDLASDVSGRIGISNDAVGLLLAHEPEMVAVVAGTGSVAMARRTSGEVVSRGGEDWVVTDYGSAFWIGLDGIRSAYRALEGGADTALLRCLVEHYSHNASEEDMAGAVSEISRKWRRSAAGPSLRSHLSRDR
jgi:hypothetical protein